jgi:hypothetical protein
MSNDAIHIDAVVDRLGIHPARTLDLDLSAPEDVSRWFVASCLLASRVDEARALAAYRALARTGPARLEDLADADPAALGARLEAAGLSRGTLLAQRLVRAALRLRGCGAGTLQALVGQAEGLEDLGARLAGLASGVGTATVLRFLRPLRDVWPAARETPLSAAARAAACHLGLSTPAAMDAADPDALRAGLRAAGATAELADVEAALERLGAFCLRGRTARCPLGDACPARPRAAPRNAENEVARARAPRRGPPSR